MQTLKDIADYFSANPDGFLECEAELWARGGIPGESRKVQTYGESKIILFPIERLPNQSHLQEYVNVVALKWKNVLDNSFQNHQGEVIFNEMKPADMFSGPINHTIKFDTLAPTEPSATSLIQILRWRDKMLVEAGLRPVGASTIFQLAKNAASAEFFASVFSDSKVPTRSELEEGIRILNEQIQGLPSERPLEIGDTVAFLKPDFTKPSADQVEYSAKVVELFASLNKLAVLGSDGSISVISYADVIRVP